jgi:hypothetical protein
MGVAQILEYIPSKCKALSSFPSAGKKKKRRRRRRRRGKRKRGRRRRGRSLKSLLSLI